MTKRNLLQHEASTSKAEIDMTHMEHQELLDWINDGNSVYDNPWYMADENGRMMDYISARRKVYGLC